jgi:hypothetical protein
LPLAHTCFFQVRAVVISDVHSLHYLCRCYLYV